MLVRIDLNNKGYKMKFKRKLTEHEKKIFTDLSKKDSLNIKGCSHTNGYYGLRYEIDKKFDYDKNCSYIVPLNPNDKKSVELANDLKIIDTILKDVFIGFYEFYNFTNEENNRLRFGYDYGDGFKGAGYMTLQELLNGSFDK